MYDVYAAKNEPVNKRMLGQALRYICHMNGCDLIYSSVKEQAPLKIFRNMMNSHIYRTTGSFAGVEGTSPDKKKEGDAPESLETELTLPQPDRDPNSAFQIYAGTDNIMKIGEPHGANSRHNTSME